MIGEIRDFETAQIAIQASLTGHLVLATLHTNDSVSAVTRLTDMGVEPFLLSSSLLGVLAQRLVRKLCPVCRRAPPAARPRPSAARPAATTGYQGRTGIFELLVADDTVQSLIHNRAPESQLFVAAERGGLRSMREDGERLVQAGITSRAELLRVTRDSTPGCPPIPSKPSTPRARRARACSRPTPPAARAGCCGPRR